MKANIKMIGLALAALCCTSALSARAESAESVVSPGCGTYFGTLYQEWPTHEVQISGELTNYFKDETHIEFNIARVNHFYIQRENVWFAHFDHQQCTFAIKYNYDPIFKNGFENTCEDDDNQGECDED